MDRLYDTPGASAWLAERGLSYTPLTLSKMRTLGGGPAYHRVGNRVRYPESALVEWTRQKLGPLRASTSAQVEETVLW